MAARIPGLTGSKGHIHLPQSPTVNGVAEGVVGLPVGATHLLPHLHLTLATLICQALGNDDVISTTLSLTSCLDGFISGLLSFQITLKWISYKEYFQVKHLE